MDQTTQSPKENSQLITYLIEFRSRIIKCLIAIVVLFGFLSLFSNDIYHFVALPLIRSLPEGSSMITISVLPFLVTLKLTLMVSIAIAMPYILYHIWSFVAPALYKKEKKFLVPFFVSSISLFYMGILFAYFIVFPIMFNFIANTIPLDVKMQTDIGKYLDFVLKLFMAFGLCFEVPVIIVLLCSTGISNVDSLKKKRPYIIVGSFIVGMFLAPPDVISQTLLALPICVLFEIGLLFSKIFIKPEIETDNCSEEVKDKKQNIDS